ncbi:MAG: class I SAM-dependent methyltransferase [Halanaerobiales bacterium]|nr:class I SAM-dependent methyltransferase [Halanaerobiales bacterium]
MYDKMFNQINNRYIELILGFIHDNFENNPNILEIACGTGTVALALAENGFNVTGSDISPEMIQIALKKNANNEKKVAFSQCDMLDLNELHKYNYTPKIASVA